MISTWRAGLSPGIWFVCCFLACAGLLVLKSPDAFGNPQFWAEDALIFFRQQWNHEWPRLLLPYAAYLHLIPRVVAWMASFAPISLIPAIYSFTALIGASLSLGYMCWKLRSHWVVIVMAAGVFLTPTNGEVFGTLTNLQWFLQFSLLAACFLPATTMGLGGWAIRLLVLAIALTGPFSSLLILVHMAFMLAGLIAPRFALLAWMPPYLASLDRWRLGMLWLGGLSQVAVAATVDQSPVVAYSLRTVVSAITRMSQPHLFGEHYLPAAAFLVLLCALSALPLPLRIEGRIKGFVLASWTLALLEVAAGSLKPGLMGDALGIGDRYFILFKPVFWLLLFLPLSRLGRLGADRAGGIVMVGILMVAVINRDHLQRAHLSDLGWREATRTLHNDRETVIPIHPRPWQLRLPPKKK